MKAINPLDILKGNTMSYTEVFGDTNGIGLGNDSDDVMYYIYDQYCMNPSCKCDDVMLRVIEMNPHESNVRVDFSVLLSLKSRKYKIVDVRRISKNHVDRIVKHFFKESDQSIKILKERYHEMKMAGKEILLESKQVESPFQKRPDRNALCPCGSGKKYKRCCGA